MIRVLHGWGFAGKPSSLPIAALPKDSSEAIMNQRLSPYARYILFALGAALGSAFGLVVGSLLTFWLGEETVRAVQRVIRRMTGEDDHPSFELLLQ